MLEGEAAETEPLGELSVGEKTGQIGMCAHIKSRGIQALEALMFFFLVF